MNCRAWFAVVFLAFITLPDGIHAEPTPVPQGLRCLKAAYPKHICTVSTNILTWCDGTRMIYRPTRPGWQEKHFEARLNHASLADQMSQPYPMGAVWNPPPSINADPGRFRHDPFFKKMYGRTAKEVWRKTAKVRWFGKRGKGTSLRVTTVNGVHHKLQAISDALERLPKKLRSIASVSAGAYRWRKVRGTPRLSAHSYAIAIDIGVKHSNYWKWQRRTKNKLIKYRNRIPREIVQIFEKHGFIWGGKWYHFDTMHFEYRPELLIKGCTGRDGR
jgi:peptidoglycan L-alanyl-D-glutamate endopeptidase CwlK